MNLLNETIEKIEECGKSLLDVAWIGFAGKDGYKIALEEFITEANREYDSGFGAEEVSLLLVVVFRDNTWLERREYDGSEWWEWCGSPPEPKETKKNGSNSLRIFPCG